MRSHIIHVTLAATTNNINGLLGERGGVAGAAFEDVVYELYAQFVEVHGLVDPVVMCVECGLLCNFTRYCEDLV